MKEKSKNFLNAVDIIIIAIVILSIAVAGFIFIRPQESTDSTSGYIDFTIELPTIKNKFKDAIKVGDPVIETVRHTPMGEVVSVSYTDAYISTTDLLQTGEMIMTPYPDHQNVKIVIRSNYTLNENGEYSIAGTTVAVGAYLHFSTPNFINSGYCISVDVLDNNQSTEWKTYLKTKNTVQEAE